MHPDMMLKNEILLTIEDLVTDFTYYDRKEDEDLPRGTIEKAVKSGVITVDEMVAHFKKHLDKTVSE